MYLGVVGRPRNLDRQNFNSRIMLERVRKTSEVARKTKHQQFTTDALADYDLKGGSWKNHHVSGMTVEDLCEVIVGAYNIDEYVF